MANRNRSDAADGAKEASLECGLVMPISPIDGCSAEHWAQVQDFLIETIEEIQEPKFSAKLVSEAADVGMILRRIVQNVYNSRIVVCDVSGKNPNVMFELGMRLAFDKPVIIIKDEKTDYSFDASVIEHLIYPRDLRYPLMMEFKERLKTAIVATYEATRKDDYQGFLKNFGTFKVAHLEERTISADEAILSAITSLQKDMTNLRASVTATQTESALSAAQIAAQYGVRGAKDGSSFQGALGLLKGLSEIGMPNNGPTEVGSPAGNPYAKPKG